MGINEGVWFLWQHPALWPAVLFLLVAPVHVWLSPAGKRSADFTATELRNMVIAGAGALFLFLACAGLYLFSETLVDMWESSSASLAAALRRGETIYPDLSTEQRYGIPYGPYLYIILALSQTLLGPTLFATKLPAIAAAIAAISLMGVAVYRRSGSVQLAVVFAGFEAAILLAFRFQAFWPKSDSLILLAVTLGLVAVLRRALPSQIVLGICAGAAVAMKPHAAAYFLPLIALAKYRGWSVRELSVCGITAAVAASLPFVVAPTQFSFPNYVGLLEMAAAEGFGVADAMRCLKWSALLAGLVVVGDQWQKGNEQLTPAELRFRRQYRVLLAIGLALASVPGATHGGGPRHLMPFVPLVLFDFSSHFCRATMLTAGRDRPLWRLLFYCSFAACLFVAIQTGARVLEAHRRIDVGASEERAELRRVLNSSPGTTFLMGAGSDEGLTLLLARHEVVLAGHPLGIEVAAIMDYCRAGLPEPDVGRLSLELTQQTGRPLAWIVPRGEPFSLSNIYDGTPVFSPAFRRAFVEQYGIAERTRFFDVYVARRDALDAATGKNDKGARVETHAPLR
jgi:hypothetical protein